MPSYSSDELIDRIRELEAELGSRKVVELTDPNESRYKLETFFAEVRDGGGGVFLYVRNKEGEEVEAAMTLVQCDSLIEQLLKAMTDAQKSDF